jgi:cell cycle checkpoint protein MEC1
MTLIKNRLNGIVTEHGLPLAVQGHVEHLIEEATSQENLSRMYRWWMPWY